MAFTRCRSPGAQCSGAPRSRNTSVLADPAYGGAPTGLPGRIARALFGRRYAGRTVGTWTRGTLTHRRRWPKLLRITNWVVPSANEEAVLRICPLADLPAGEALRVDEVDPPIAVFHTDDGEVFAIDDTCTNQDASLDEGWLVGRVIEWPPHAS